MTVVGVATVSSPQTNHFARLMRWRSPRISFISTGASAALFVHQRGAFLKWIMPRNVPPSTLAEKWAANYSYRALVQWGHPPLPSSTGTCLKERPQGKIRRPLLGKRL